MAGESYIQRQNVVLDQGGSNQINIYTVLVEEVREKPDLAPITIPTPKADRNGEFVPNSIADLLKVTSSIQVRGFIENSDKSKFRDIFSAGGPVAWTNYDGESFNNEDFLHSRIVLKKIMIRKTGNSEQGDLEVEFQGFLVENDL